MTSKHVVGTHVGNNKHRDLKVEAEDGLIAAQHVKRASPSTMITYAGRRNKRREFGQPGQDITEKLRIDETIQILLERGDRLHGY